MIWEGDPAPASLAKLQALGIKSIVFDPCGNRPETGDWLSVMQGNVANLRGLR
jgi:zinc transport system substrate-binding protein